MAGAGIIQAELTIEMGQIAAKLNEASSLLAKYAAGAGAAMKPANESLVTTYDKLKDIKGEAIQHQRVFRFYGDQLAELTGIARETGSALTGMIAGLASGMWVMAGIEGIKLAMSLFKDETDDTSKRLEEFKKKAHDAAIEIAQLNRELLGKAKWSPEQIEMKPLQAARVNALDWKIQAAGETDPFQKRVLENRAKEDEATYARLGGAQREADLFKIITAQGILNDRKAEQAELDKVNIVLQQRYNEQLAAGNKAAADAAKQALDVAQNRGMLDAIVGVNESEGQALTQTLTQAIVQAAKNAQIAAKGQIDKAQAKGLWDAMVGIDESEGQDLKKTPGQVISGSALSAQKELNAEASKTVVLFGAVGDAISSAFSAIGNAIGGMTGDLIAQIATVAMLTVKFIGLAIAASMASAAETPIVGPWAAIAGGIAVAAAVASLIASIASYEVGTSYVPRTGLAMLHQGEAVIPASQNRGGRGGNVSIVINAVDGPSVYRTLTDHRGQVARVFREMSRDGIG